MKVAVVANTTWYIFNFRRNLMAALQRSGHQVVAIAGTDDYVPRLTAAGFRHRGVPLSVAGMNPLREWISVVALRSRLRDERPDVVLTYTPKASIYTAIALLGSRTPTIVNVSGLGRAFVRGGWLKHVVHGMYRLALRRAHTVVFQNADDEALFISGGLVAADHAVRVPGSGVDLDAFHPRPDSPGPDVKPTHFLMVARLIWEKGVAEFVEAARQVKVLHPTARFTLLGPTEPSADSGATTEQVSRWRAEQLVDHAGTTDDVRPFLANADCVVLPSYREGVPRSLLEAAAMARPIIATDVPGCRAVVDDRLNGFLCRAQDSGHLAEAMLRFLQLSLHERTAMGRRGRAKVEQQFDERLVIARYLDLVAAAAGRLRTAPTA
jgi:glycosyltransferase involved in cell wall biosynthesis